MSFRQRHWRHAWWLGLVVFTGFALYLTTWRSALGPLLPVAQDVHEFGGILYGAAVVGWSGRLYPWPARRAAGAPGFTQFGFFLIAGLAVTGVGLLVGPSLTRAIATVGHAAFAAALVIWTVWHLLAHRPRVSPAPRDATPAGNARPGAPEPAPRARDAKPGIPRRALLRWMGGAALAVPLVAATPTLLGMVGGRLLGASGGSDSGARSGFVPYTVVNGFPHVDLATWRLELDGLGPSHRWTWQEWQRESMQPLTVNFRCVTGWVVPDVRFGGVNLEAWLLHHGWKPAEHPWVNFFSADGVYTESLSAAQIRQHQPILATTMDGQLLPVAQGFPMRLYVPRMYGYKSIKWLNRVEVSSREEIGFWEQRGYPENAYYGSYSGI